MKKTRCKTCGQKLPFKKKNGKFDKVAYQKQYMRERRAFKKAMNLPVDLKGDAAALYDELMQRNKQ
jgi:hypothetical protein